MFFPREMTTDQAEHILVAEVVREKFLDRLREELPHALVVITRSIEERSDSLVVIEADVVVERDSQKGIVIGAGGSMLRTAGEEARAELEATFREAGAPGSPGPGGAGLATPSRRFSTGSGSNRRGPHRVPCCSVPPVQLMVTCLIDALVPEVGEAVVEVLERRGLEVEFPEAQTCCGQPAFNAGLSAEAARMAAHTVKVFDATEGPIVAPSGSCTAFLIHHAPSLLAGEDEADAAHRVAAPGARAIRVPQRRIGLMTIAAMLPNRSGLPGIRRVTGYASWGSPISPCVYWTGCRVSSGWK